jgi:hypothetical protein
MTRRRGQTTGRINERDYPHIVELPVPQGVFRDTSLAIEGFHNEHGFQSKLGRGSYDEGQTILLRRSRSGGRIPSPVRRRAPSSSAPASAVTVKWERWAMEEVNIAGLLAVLASSRSVAISGAS